MEPGVRIVVLVHGAGSGPWVFDEWELPGAVAVDLHEGLDVANASMRDYAERVAAAIAGAPDPAGVVGWSMGGLVAMMAAAMTPPAALVAIEPSAPAEVLGLHPGVALRSGTFDPETAYGPLPQGMRTRPESLRARSERKRGISVPAIPCPFLVVSGAEFPEERGRAVADHYRADHFAFPGLRHFDLVRNPRVRRVVAGWLQGAGEPGGASIAW